MATPRRHANGRSGLSHFAPFLLGGLFIAAVIAVGCASGETSGLNGSSEGAGGDDSTTTASAQGTGGSPGCGDTASDPKNCGACGKACAVSEVCSLGQCASSCAAGTTRCGGSCVDISGDAHNCGACGKACAAGEVCSMSACALECAVGTTKCGSGCVDTTTDSANCGGCGKPCANGEVCSMSACSVQCGGGTTKCGDACVQTMSDPLNCGGCNMPCGPYANASPVCSAGACAEVCAVGNADCNKSLADGCETPIASDIANCGTCNKVCPAAPNAQPDCKAGACALICAAGFGDCDAMPADGCETNTSNDPNNCGKCGMACGNGMTCTAGGCVVGAGYGDWLVGTIPNGTNYDNYDSGPTPAQTGYHYKGTYDGYQCWWENRNQAWNTTAATNYYQLALHFNLNPATGVVGWCFPSASTPTPLTYMAYNYFDINNIGAFGWCAEQMIDSAGFVCLK